MNARQAKREAYALAAMTLLDELDADTVDRLACERLHRQRLTPSDHVRMRTAVADLAEQLATRCTVTDAEPGERYRPMPGEEPLPYDVAALP